ncbi:hypothetical protein KFK09_011373 [Dendrobium nobile]|uniref:Uncharacterized protein n=1 Tax=Dendrobium nobile TaxID=94219 RepID=A0A8T3BED3_DENNO|nr:hypothetical protein KFK09_011373 [Dendrobium nobile]
MFADVRSQIQLAWAEIKKKSEKIGGMEAVEAGFFCLILNQVSIGLEADFSVLWLKDQFGSLQSFGLQGDIQNDIPGFVLIVQDDNRSGRYEQTSFDRLKSSRIIRDEVGSSGTISTESVNWEVRPRMKFGWTVQRNVDFDNFSVSNLISISENLVSFCSVVFYVIMDLPDSYMTDGQSTNQAAPVNSTAPVVGFDTISQFATLVAQMMSETQNIISAVRYEDIDRHLQCF